ncbi:MAG: VWA domain-containing protein [Ignavibacteria bacterium]|nr:VWA domain-containing protein [Ignavibacteria bacterium]
MWPREGSNECYGVDAAYVYDVPKAEMDNWRWPPDTVVLFGVKFPFFVMPKWVGDPQLFEVPPREIAVPEFSLSLRRYTGFRINGEPLPNVGINRLNHTYSIEKKGTGEPFKFQILDSNYNVLLESIIPRYEDNCGFLKIKIEEKAENQPVVDICNVEAICDSNNVLAGLRVWSKIFVQDTNNPTGFKNILKSINPSQISVIENGVFKCDVEINCDNTEGMSTGLLVDVSPSMDLNIQPGDLTKRIDATKTALKKFVSSLTELDSTFLMSFATEVILNQDWTKDKTKLTKAIDELDTLSGKTALFKAIIAALDKINQSKQRVRHLLVLSDGANTVPFSDKYPSDSIQLNNEVLNEIKNRANNIPIYIVALGFGKNDSTGIRQIETIARSTFGKVNYINNKKGLDSIYSNFKNSIDDNACCVIYFNIDPCAVGTQKYIRLLFSPSDTLLLTKVISFNCDSCYKITSVQPENLEIKSLDDVNVYPNPTRNITHFEYSITKQSRINIKLTDINGNIIKEYSDYHEMPGKYYQSIDINNLQSGTYFLTLFINEQFTTKKVIILR